MKRACFVYLFLCLSTGFLLSQSNSTPIASQTTRFPGSAPRLLPRLSLRRDRTTTTGTALVISQTSGLNFAPAVAYGSAGGGPSH